jgi:hypothetical protein
LTVSSSSAASADTPTDQPSMPSPAAAAPARRMSTRNRFLFFLVAWLIVLMPFLFWWNTWFGRRLSDHQLTQYLSDLKHPRHIQHALVQLSDRIRQGDSAAVRWYPEIVRLASCPVDEVRNTDAWVMGQDTSAADFHQTLLKMLGDSSALVRGNAALSLVRFGDASGRPQILELLRPSKVIAPSAGSVTDASTVGTTIRQGGLIARLQDGGQSVEVRSPTTGRIRTLSAPAGSQVAAGVELASVDPGDDQTWEALRALYLIGRPEDLPVIQLYARDSPQISDRVRQQAALTEKVIRERSISQP